MKLSIELGWGMLDTDDAMRMVSVVPSTTLSLVSRVVNCQKLTSNTPPPKAKNPTKLETETLRFECGAIKLMELYPKCGLYIPNFI